MTDAVAASKQPEHPPDLWERSEDDLFELVLNPEVSGLIIDISRDEVRQIVQAGELLGEAPGDFIRRVLIESSTTILAGTSAESPAAGS